MTEHDFKRVDKCNTVEHRTVVDAWYQVHGKYIFRYDKHVDGTVSVETVGFISE